jgi:CubicO group peptidase (beta-lactamase class C family)
MEQVIQSYVAKKQFMGAVLVALGNDILLDKGYGSADLEWNIPDSPTTKFRLGSITKQFTAVSILLLQERGKLNVQDLVKKYMPDAPAAWDKITVFNLLTHTSGIPNFTSFQEYRSKEPFPQTPEQIIALFRDKPLDFPPGEKWNYSNSGYIVLGYLIEKIGGESYAKFVQENIFDPLGMKDSGYDSNSAIIPDRASGYAPTPNGLQNAGYINMTVPFSAGGLYSTTSDLLRWEQGLFGGKLLSPALLKEMTTPFKNDYAFGLQVHTANGRQVIDHGGGIEGFNTALAYYPEEKLAVVVLGNVNGTAPQEIAQYLGALAENGKVVLPSERKEVHIDPKIFDGYVGDYALTPSFILKVTRDGDRFITQATGQGQVEIFPEGDHDFFAKMVDAQITFVADEQGRATALILHQAGMDQRGERVEGAAAALAPKEYKQGSVDPKVFDGYVGTHQLAPGFSITITREGDHLFGQATHQPKFEIFPESEKDYFFKVVDAQITFVTNSQGRATELILHQGERNMPGTRTE